jgi:PAS domain-containing protein
VNDAYWQFDGDRERLEHSLELATQELLERKDQLRRINADLEMHMSKRTVELTEVVEALAVERDLFETLMDNILDTIYFKDTDSKFTRINRAQASVLGVATPEEAIGKSDFDFFHTPNLAQSFYDEEQLVMETGETLINRVEFNPTQMASLAGSQQPKCQSRIKRGM